METTANTETNRPRVRAVLADPEKGTFEEVQLNSGDPQHVQSLLGCRLFDAVRLRDGHAVYVDDEGLMGDPSAFVLLHPLLVGGTMPLAGKALFVGPVDDDGYVTDCQYDAAWFKDNVLFLHNTPDSNAVMLVVGQWGV